MSGDQREWLNLDLHVIRQACSRYQSNKALVSLSRDRRFFVRECLIPDGFLQLSSFANGGTKMVLYINAAKDQGIDT